jgi:hypothetical protein
MSTKGHAATRYVGTNAERLAQETSILTIGTKWVETDGNLAIYVWNGIEWVRTQDTYQQTVTVAKSGGDFTTIQAAIDSITDAAADKRYCVLVYPGDYAETVVGSDYVELMGLKAREAVNITGATGPLYTFPDNEGHIFNFKFSLSPTTAAETIIDIPATVVARQAIGNCLFVSTSASDVATSIITADGGTLDFYNNRIVMTNTYAAGGAIRTQRVFDISGDAALHIYLNTIDVDISDVNDRITLVDDSSTTGGAVDFAHNLVNLTSNNAGAYSGIVRALNLVSTAGRVRSLSNSIAITSLEAGGTGRGEYIRINTAAGGGLVASTSNQVRVEGFATNYWANAAAGDEVTSHFDDIVAVDGETGAGTFTFVNSLSEGEFSLTGDLIPVGDSSGLSYGSCYGNEIAWTQAAAVQNTWYDISDADMVSGPLHNVTHDGNGQLTVLIAGMYLADWSGAFEADAANVHVQVTLSVNGTETDAAINHFETFAISKQSTAAGNTILDLAVNDTVNASIRTTDAGAPDLSADHLMLRLAMIGGT